MLVEVLMVQDGVGVVQVGVGVEVVQAVLVVQVWAEAEGVLLVLLLLGVEPMVLQSTEIMILWFVSQ